MKKSFHYLFVQILCTMIFAIVYHSLSTEPNKQGMMDYIWYSLTILSTVGYRPANITFQEHNRNVHYATIIQTALTIIITAYFI